MMTLPEGDEIDHSVQMIDDLFGINPIEVSKQGSSVTYRKPKFLANKLTNLMRDTKSSAQRNRYRGQISNNFGQGLSIGGSNLVNPDEVGVGRKSPAKGGVKPSSPKKRQHSPF
jgi:hypothetical protein